MLLLNIILFIFIFKCGVCEYENCSGVKCTKGQYCSQLHDTCRNCSTICTEGSNFDQQLCTSMCKDYLFDKREDVRELQDQVKSLQVLVKIAFILSAVAIAITCILILILTYVWCKRKGFKIKCPIINIHTKHNKQNGNNNNKVSITSNNGDISNLKIQTNKNGGDLHLDIPDNNSPSNTIADTTADSPATLTTTISRRGAPSQSRALDYAYDNPAMSTQGTNGSRADSSM